MKTLISLFSIVLCLSYGKAQWTEIDTGFDVPYYADVFAVNSQVAFVTGPNGLILKTSDGGETWQQKDSGTDLNLGLIQFITPQIGFIGGANGYLIKTEDGGETWVHKIINGIQFFSGLSFVNEDLVFLSGRDLESNSIIIKSTDGGDNWEIIPIAPPVEKLDEIQFFNEQVGYASTIGFPGYNYGILKTDDGGTNWIQLESTTTPFKFIDENTGFFYFDGLYETIDGGYNFELLGYGEGQIFSNIYVVDENNAWGIINGLLNGDGSSQGIVKVHILPDGTYTEEIWYDGDEETHMSSIHFADENTGYIIGSTFNGPTIWKNSTGINTMGINEPTIFNEIKVYPNPVSEEINILFEKAFSGVVSLYDLTGKQVYSSDLANKNNAVINVEKFAKGVYILLIKAHGKIHTQKLIVN